MLFFFKPTEIHLDCFTNSHAAFNFYPVDSTRKFVPDWYKKLPSSFPWSGGIQDTPTLKSCTGFNSYFKKGFTIPLWSDLLISVQEPGIRWQYADFFSTAGIHPYEQMGDYIDSNEYSHLKLISPWVFSCKDNIDWIFMQHSWEKKPDIITMPPGIVNYKYLGATNINIIVNRIHKNKILLEAGRPLVNVVPLTEKKVVHHNHLLDDEDYKKIFIRKNPRMHFFHRFNKIKKMTNENEQKKQGKCPFGF